MAAAITKAPPSVVEVSPMFSANCSTRPSNFIVLKYFLLGMLISNGIESILIVPKTLSMTDENEEQLKKLDAIYKEHDEFRAQLDAYNKVVKEVEEREFEDLQVIEGEPAQGSEHHEHGHVKVTLPPPRAEEHVEAINSNQVIEIMVLVYGILTLALGLYAVFKEIPKLLMVFIGVVALGLVIMFFSGLTLLVFMAVLNDIIIAMVSFKYLQMLQAPDYSGGEYGLPGQVSAVVGGYPEAQYNVDLNQPSTYR